MPDNIKDNLKTANKQLKSVRNQVLPALILFVFLLGAFIYLKTRPNPELKPNSNVVEVSTPGEKKPDKMPEPDIKLSVQESEAQINPHLKISFSEITGTKPATVESLPRQVKSLIVSEGTNVKVSEIEYSDGKTGHKIEHDLLATSTLTLISFFELTLKNVDNYSWQRLFNASSTSVAVVEAENLDYKVRVKAVKEEGKEIKVTIQTVSIDDN
ncbi:MAG TPA: hypothetical protein VD998_01820 [Verrucomicrobiae bacterium]|nr:hypothetical protein [Verrucomicrobiae bacterium]